MAYRAIDKSTPRLFPRAQSTDMIKEINHTDNHRRIKPLNSHPQFSRREPLVLSSVEIDRRGILYSFDIVYLLAVADVSLLCFPAQQSIRPHWADIPC